jgi:putative sigma-54 modulation protein
VNVKNTKKSLVKAAKARTVSPAKNAAKNNQLALRDAASGLRMKLILSTHNVTLTDAIENHIVSRIQQLEHLDPRAIDARVVIEHDHQKVAERQFKCSIRVTEPGPDLFAEDAESDLYAAIDLVAKKIEQQMRKRRSKFKARNHSEASKSKRNRQESAL